MCSYISGISTKKVKEFNFGAKRVPNEDE